MFLTPRSGIDESAARRLSVNHVMIAERIEAEVSPTRGHIHAVGCDHHAESHDWQATPTFFGGKEAPVVEHVATQGVTHVVGRERGTFQTHHYVIGWQILWRHRWHQS